MAETLSANRAWDDATWHRYGLLDGVVFVALSVIGFLVTGAPPARDADGAKIAAYFVDNESGIKLGAILFGIALIFGLMWLGSLWRVIGRLEPDGPRLAVVAIVGFVMAGGLAAVSQALFVAPALRVDTLQGAAELAWAVGYVTYSFALAVTAAHMLALGALVLWLRFLPTWTGWLALLSAAACAVATIGAGTSRARSWPPSSSATWPGCSGCWSRRSCCIDALPPEVRSGGVDLGAAVGGRHHQDRGEGGKSQRSQHGDLVRGVVAIEMGRVVEQVGHAVEECRAAGGPGHQHAPRRQRHEGDEGEAEVEATDVTHEVLVERTVHRHPHPPEPGEVVVERAGEALRPHPHNEAAPGQDHERHLTKSGS